MALANHGVDVPALAQGCIAPSASDSFLSGTTRSGSTSMRKPSPVHVEHAPFGLLKLKVRGSSSPMEMRQWTQAKCSEKSISSPPCTATRTTPPAILSALSTESATRPGSALSPTTRRSTTTSMVCHLFLSRSNVSERSRTSPLTRTRTYPAARASSKTSLCSPFRRLTIGAMIWILLSSGRARTASTICCTVCICTGRPQL